VSSYARRASERNHSDVQSVEAALRERGLMVSKGRSAPDRLAAWRHLGRLHESAFTIPQYIAENWVSDRQLCLKCARGNAAHGRSPRVGLVCVRHKRWLEGQQIDLHRFPPALAAERHFRNRLATRGVPFDAPVMVVARDAVLAAIGPSEVERRRRASMIQRTQILVYPEQVALARLLAQPFFVTVIAEPDVKGDVRYAHLVRGVQACIPVSEDAEPWRAVNRIWQVASRLCWEIRDARLVGRDVRATQYNLPRHS
jgi:hypothetical protein